MVLSSVDKAKALISRACTAKVVIEALSWPCARTLFATLYPNSYLASLLARLVQLFKAQLLVRN